MKLRDVYNRIRDHLFAQNEQSHDGNGSPVARGDSCEYKSRTGLKCAVGCLISDEYYCVTLEGKKADHVWVLAAVAKSLGFFVPAGFLICAQDVHDSFTPDKWDQKLPENEFQNFDLDERLQEWK